MTTPTDLQIRKALEKPLRDAIVAAYGADAVDPEQPTKCIVAWPNMGFDPNKLDKSIVVYCRPTLHGPVQLPRTLGSNPAVSSTGLFKIGCFVKAGVREDPLSDLVDTVKAAYSYDSDLAAGGAKIQIEGKTGGDAVPLSGWLYRSADISWRINI